MEPFSVSILLTKDEYCASAAFRLPVISWGVPAGLFLMISGMVVWILELGTLITWGFLMLGVLFALFDSVFAPMLARMAAAAHYTQSRPEAVTVTFGAEALTVASARMAGTIAYDQMTRAEETVHFFHLDFGAQLWLCVPRRVLTADQITALQAICERQNRSDR